MQAIKTLLATATVIATALATLAVMLACTPVFWLAVIAIALLN